MNEETSTTGYDQYFTESTEGLDIVANNIEVNCITSASDKFSLDTNGNLTVNSLTINDANNNTLSFEAICVLLPPGAAQRSKTTSPSLTSKSSAEIIAEGSCE